MNRPRTVDYPFTVIELPIGPLTVIELPIGPDGGGEGKMSLFAKITADEKNTSIMLEDYDTSRR